MLLRHTVGARRTGTSLMAAGISAKIVELPRDVRRDLESERG